MKRLVIPIVFLLALMFVGGAVYFYLLLPLWLQIVIGGLAVMILVLGAVVTILVARHIHQKTTEPKVNGFFSLPL